MTRLGEQSVQLQIADKVRIEVAKAAIGGYQGQPPVVEPRQNPSRERHGKSALESSSPLSSSSSSSPPSASIRSSPTRYGIHSPGWLMDKQLKLGLDLKGGVHLVLRVQTDDALRLETETEMERLREELRQGRTSPSRT